jgi:hypothetical protein
VKEKTLQMLVGEWREFLSGADEKEMDAFVWPQERDGPQGDQAFLAELSKMTGKRVTRGRPGRPLIEARTRME